MALPSQNNESRSSVMHQTGAGISSNGKIAIIALGLILAAGGIYALTKFMPASNTPPAVTNPDEKLATNDPAKTGPVTIQRNDLNTNPAPVTTGTVLLPGATTPPAAGGTTPTTPTNTTPNTAPGAAHNTTPGATNTTPGTTPGAPNTITAGYVPPANTGVLAYLNAGDTAYATNKMVEARLQYSKVLLSTEATAEQKATIRTKVQAINDTLLFSPTVDPADTLVENYKVQPGDALEKIRKKRELATDYLLIQRINRMSDPNKLRVGQTLKLVRGPFHAVVNKADFRVDIYAGSPDRASDWLYIKSFKCGLGDPQQGSATPVGNYTIKKNSKLVNPHWTNPRTGEKFDHNNPLNPIGEYWLGWQGVGDNVGTTGYGFHGTIEPDSIGQQKSMGCVRFAPDDIAQVYELLVEEVSVVRVLP